MHTNIRKETNTQEAALSTKNLRNYILGALVILVLLSLAGQGAPNLQPYLIPILCALYALPATTASMYHVVVNRHHKQSKFNPSGRLSHFNRRWLFIMVGLLAFNLFSGGFFLLQAPTWSLTEWILIWLSPISFFAIYQLTLSLSKEEYASPYQKSYAIKWGVAATAIVLGIIFTVVSVVSTNQAQTTLTLQQLIDTSKPIETIIQSTSIPFENSPCALFGETDKLISFADSVTTYELSELQSIAFLPWAIILLVINVSVFLGVVSLFVICFLTHDEILSIFHLLPTQTESTPEKTPTNKSFSLHKPYIIAVIITFLVFAGLFSWGEFVAQDARNSDEYTCIDRLINDAAIQLDLVMSHTMDDIQQTTETMDALLESNEGFRTRLTAYVDESTQNLNYLANEYYDSCINNIGTYEEWCNSFVGKIATFANPFDIWSNLAIDEFEKAVINPVDASKLQNAYADYIEGLKSLYSEYLSIGFSTDSDLLDSIIATPTADEKAENTSTSLDLWPTLEGEERIHIANQILLGEANENASDNPESFNQSIQVFINSEHEKTVATIAATSKVFFLYSE